MLAKAMRTVSVTYGCLTTFMQTIFVIMEAPDEKPVLSHLYVIKHSEFAKEENKAETLELASPRLGLF
jgi:hypothetical protein